MNILWSFFHILKINVLIITLSLLCLSESVLFAAKAPAKSHGAGQATKKDRDTKDPKKEDPKVSVPAKVGVASTARTVTQTEVKLPTIDFPFLILLAQSITMPEPVLYDPHAPKAKDIRGTFGHIAKHPGYAMLHDDFLKQLKVFRLHAQEFLNDEKVWVEGKKPDLSFYDIENQDFTPYIQAVRIPVGSRIEVWGDLHGGFHSLMNMLNGLYEEKVIDANFKILDPKCYLMFLGDFVDRGMFGVEVVYTLLRLKNANPGRVFFVRGNHEEFGVNKRMGFDDELRIKVGKERYDIYAKHINRFYNLLPVSLEINDQLLCCHGGLDHCYDNRGLRALAGPIACQMLTVENYHPYRLMSQLSGECVVEIADAMIAYTRAAVCKRYADQMSEVITIFDHYKKALSECESEIESTDKEKFDENKKFFDDNYVSFCTIRDQLNNLAKPDMEIDKDAIENFEALEGVFQQIHDQDMVNLNNLVSRYVNAGITLSTIEELDRLHGKCRKVFNKIKLIQMLADCKAVLESEEIIFLRTYLLTIFKEAQTVDELNAIEERLGVNFLAFPQEFQNKIREFFIYHMIEGPNCLGCMGLAWNDSCTDEKGPDIDMEQSYRYCLGARLSREMMRIQGIHGVIRAHQHYGEMAALLEAHGGVVELWDKTVARMLSMKNGSVYTLQVAYSAGSRISSCPRDIYTRLHILDEAYTSWRLEKVEVIYGPVVGKSSIPAKAIAKKKVLKATPTPAKPAPKKEEAEVAGQGKEPVVTGV